MKRRISFILALLILAGSMSCGSGSGDKTQDTTASDTTTSGETTAEEVLQRFMMRLCYFQPRKMTNRNMAFTLWMVG